jgi:hypothetical protein
MLLLALWPKDIGAWQRAPNLKNNPTATFPNLMFPSYKKRSS